MNSSTQQSTTLQPPDEDTIETAESMPAEREAAATAALRDQANGATMTAFQHDKLIKDTTRSWDLFYKRNTVNFFKDRHWTEREFPELRPTGGEPCSKRLLELGCGVGNFIYPMLESNPELYIYGCDLSKRAVDFVKADPKYTESRCKAFVCDITTNPLTDSIPPQSLDIVSALFCFSAIPPARMHLALNNIKLVLKPGGTLIIRDYGLYDAAQLRFKSTAKMDDRFYARGDGTFSYFFSTDALAALFNEDGGWECVANTYVFKEVTNKKRELTMDRVFVQARYKLL
ncbi:S-adenosyl-L-methionine-dependent methyltransferase [Powellomyces hirtus]|nr:S-adenosyl-L-methionine-dependent methyltransferase [Powellomyces hirtus]